MKCKHENTRKLFWLDQTKGKWMTTNFSICLSCENVIGMQPVKTESKDTEPTLQEKTHDTLQEDSEHEC